MLSAMAWHTSSHEVLAIVRLSDKGRAFMLVGTARKTRAFSPERVNRGSPNDGYPSPLPQRRGTKGVR